MITRDISFSEEGLEVHFSLNVTQVGENLYRIESFPLWVDSAGFMDVIEVEESSDGLKFKKVVEKSDWKVYDFILAAKYIESEKIQKLLDHVIELGGYSERVAGGCLFIGLPPNIDFDPKPFVMGYTKTKLNILQKIFSIIPKKYSLKFDNDGLLFRSFFRKKKIRWADIQKVQIETNNKGPFECDVFFVIVTNENEIKVPQDLVESGALLSKIQQFPEFDNEAVIEAMSCMENKTFVCWQK